MPAAAIGGIAAGVGAIGAALIGSNAQKKAADRVDNAANRQLGYQQQAANRARELTAPWYGAGQQALHQYMGELGMSPGLDSSGRKLEFKSKFTQTPGYQFVRDQGIKALDNSAASRGLLLSGAQTKELAKYSSGLASQEYNNYMNRLAGVANSGMQAANMQINPLTRVGGHLTGAAAQAGQYDANAGQYISAGLAGAMAPIAGHYGYESRNRNKLRGRR